MIRKTSEDLFVGALLSNYVRGDLNVSRLLDGTGGKYTHEIHKKCEWCDFKDIVDHLRYSFDIEFGEINTKDGIQSVDVVIKRKGT